MGLLDKTKPTATRESVLRHAIIFGVGCGVVYPILGHWSSMFGENWIVGWPFVVAFGAAMGALMEWQLGDDLDIHEVVLEVEEEYGIKIPDALGMEIDTIGDLFDATLSAIRAQHPNFVHGPPSESEVWERIKMLLIRQLHLRPEQVVKSARFYDLGL